MSQSEYQLSIVVPVYRSEKIIPQLIGRVDKVFVQEGIRTELVLIEDCGGDQSFEVISEEAKKYSWVKGYKLSRNFGQQAATWTGFTKARGEVIAVMDDDLQDPPESLRDLYYKLQEGYDVVYGIRKRYRKDPPIRRLCYWIFYRVLNTLSSIELPLDAGDFCCMRRKVVDAILAVEDVNPYLRGIRAWVGFKQIGVEYQRNQRFAGESGYNFFKYFIFALTGVFSFSYSPLRILAVLGLIISGLDLVVMGILAALAMNNVNVPMEVWLMLVILMTAGWQFMAIGVLGEYLNKTYHQTKAWPVAIVDVETN
ncbi:MAG: glycosyltransferase family 2 protein [Verrucomicrobiota bacterium]